MSIRNLLFATVLLFVTGCTSDLFLDHTGNMPEESHINQIHLGQTQAQVYNILGYPSIVSGLSDDHWIYMESSIRRFAFMRPTELSRNILALSFKDGKLVSIERRTLEDGNNISIDSDETKPSDREVGFFRKYFGGVGQYNMFGNGKNNEGL